MPLYSIQEDVTPPRHASFYLKESFPEIHLRDSLNTHLSSFAFSVGAKTAGCQHSSNSSLQWGKGAGEHS